MKNDSEHFEFICGATLVAPATVVTAARCVKESDGSLINSDLLRVGLGKSYMPWNDTNDIHAQQFEVAFVTNEGLHAILAGDKISELEKSLKFLEPLSFVFLKGRITFNSFVRPICSDSQGFNSEIEYLNATLCGWDRNTNQTSYNSIFYENEECKARIFKLKKHDAELEKEIRKFGRFCTDSVLSSESISSTRISNGNVIKSKHSTRTKSCRIPSAPNTIYFEKKTESEKENLQPNSVVDGNGAVVHIECADGARESTSWQGEHYMVCYDGQWYPPNNVCIKLCQMFNHSNSVFECTLDGEPVSCEEHMRPRTVVTRTCKPRFTFRDVSKTPPTSICKDNGNWSHTFLDCFTECGSIDHEYQSNDTELLNLVNFPWKAGVYKKKSDSDDFEFICGASLVGALFLLSAARCVRYSNGTLISNDLLRVGLGKKYMQWNDPRDIHAQIYEVSKATNPMIHAKLAGHQLTDRNKSLDSIEPWSFIFLKKKVDLNSFVRPICTVTTMRYRLYLNYTLMTSQMEYLNGTIYGWDHDGNHLSYDIKLYTNEYCITLISNSNLTNRDELENEMMKLGRFCTDRSLPDTFYGTSVIHYNATGDVYSFVGILIGIYDSISVFQGVIDLDATFAVLDYYNSFMALIALTRNHGSIY
ncbi:uncharacterized protein LOC111045030 isoform X2 [Nilaparvata lugens]|uniref:uncharacterized protein LOC111045030 isoform X2 n=1 Tax=Nilaparvata lugens TaxID=108931 RepID=UPI00193CC33E|nr:uncharacterized protein LOC111045030 isoform X2 [Nilaparvata lugens]